MRLDAKKLTDADRRFWRTYEGGRRKARQFLSGYAKKQAAYYKMSLAAYLRHYRSEQLKGIAEIIENERQFHATRTQSIVLREYRNGEESRKESRWRDGLLEEIDHGSPADYARHWELEGPRVADDSAPG